MRSSAARLAANRANAARSTGPRTAHGKAISSRNALTHGAYASDDTLLALPTPENPDPHLSLSPQTTSLTPPTSTPDLVSTPAKETDLPPLRPQSPRLCPATIGAAVGQIGHLPTADLHGAAGATPADANALSPAPHPDLSGVVPAIRIHPEAVLTPVAGSNMAPLSYLTTLTEQYQPVSATELILVRRLAALALRLEHLNEAIAALPSLGERRALVDHLVERYAIGESVGQFRNQPEWSGALRRYDDPSYVNPLPDQIRDDPALDPDPATCATVYTLSSRRAETFSRLETAAGRAFIATLTQLRAEQTARRRAESYPPLEYTPRQDLLNAVNTQVRSTLAAYGLDPDLAPRPNIELPPSPDSTPTSQPALIDRNEPTATDAPIPIPLVTRPGPASTIPAIHAQPHSPPAPIPPTTPVKQPCSENEPTASAQNTGNEASAHVPARKYNPNPTFQSVPAALLAKASGTHRPFSTRRQRRKHHR